jgi:hypothetical protein
MSESINWSLYINKKVKLSFSPCRRQEGEEICLLLVNDLDTRWGLVSVTLRPRFTLWERNVCTHCTVGRVGINSFSGQRCYQKTLCLCRG